MEVKTDICEIFEKHSDMVCRLAFATVVTKGVKLYERLHPYKNI